MSTADSYSERAFGAAVFAAFDPARAAHRSEAAALHDRLVEIGFGPRQAAALFGLGELSALRPPRVRYYDGLVLPESAAGLAARFFCLHLTQKESALRAWLGEGSFRFLAEMSAIVPAGDEWRSIAAVTWFDGRLILTDARAINVVWPEDEVFEDIVMPPGGDSVGLVRVAPRAPRRAVLDLCCGAGAQALAAAAYGKRVTGVDVNPRALRFANFNAAANRVDNAEFLLGDTYRPLEAGRRFDAILSNPPFVPWPQDGAPLLFRGGGPRGEDVLARILTGSVERLEPAGSLAIVADLADAEELPERIVRWQGRSLSTLILLQRRYELVDYAESHAGHLPEGERGAETLRLLRHFSDAGIRTLDFGYILQDGAEGGTHILRSAAARSGSLCETIADWFAHQRRIASDSVDNALLALAPGIGLVRATATGADGSTSDSYHALAAPPALLEPLNLSASLYEILERVAASTVRLREVDDATSARDLRDMLDRGYLRLRP